MIGGEREHSPFSENGRVYSHSGACNGEFGGVAVSRNQVMIVRENLSVEATKNPTETSGFFGGEREIRLTARTGEFTRIVERATESSAA